MVYEIVKGFSKNDKVKAGQKRIKHKQEGEKWVNTVSQAVNYVYFCTDKL